MLLISPNLVLEDGEDISLTTVQLASSFLFSVGFHTKKSVRGNATDWYEILSQHLRYQCLMSTVDNTNPL